MSMSVGGKAGQKAEINMTPMIDVLLVLIIIFMVITPIAPKGLTAALPEQARDAVPPQAPSHDVVVSIGKEQQIRVNQDVVELAALPGRLTELYRVGAGLHLFVRGDRSLEYREVVRIIDIARGAGWDRVGLMTQ